jgi:hypothetical protein
VPTARLRVLFVLVVLAHHRRRVVHFNVTEHPLPTGPPNRSWPPSRTTPRPPISCATVTRSNGEQFRHQVKGMRIEEVLTAPHRPWQNPFAERSFGLTPDSQPWLRTPDVMARSVGSEPRVTRQNFWNQTRQNFRNEHQLLQTHQITAAA